MRSAVVLSIDQGTTGTRAIFYDRTGREVASAYQEFRQFFPKPGWVEHDPVEIWRSTLAVITRAMRASQIQSRQIIAIGITNQRETTVLWDAKTGRPVHHAIVWQDRRTADDCARLKKRGWEKVFRSKTGLVLDPYFSGTKLQWLLNRSAAIRRRAQRGQLRFGTIDTWLLWNLTGGRSHATDYTNASRTLLFNIHTRRWDAQLLRLLKIPAAVLPQALESGAHFGDTAAVGPLRAGIPIRAMIGDQQAALYGQACVHTGQAKNTYGTGCFLVMNLGRRRPRRDPFGLLLTLACDEKGGSVYALEGSVFIAGAAVQWLRDGLGFFKRASETESLIRGLKDTGGVTLIPAFAGLGSPYWNSDARGMISGITRGTKRAHIIRAALESIAQQNADVAEQMHVVSGARLRELKVDGGATRNRFLMQFQADLLQIPVLVSGRSESTAWGAAKLAGRQAGFWSGKAAFGQTAYKLFPVRMPAAEAKRHRTEWQTAMRRLLSV